MQSLWTWQRSRVSKEKQERLSTDAPAPLAVLSFAGLDTHDCLLYPLLAHELGHFIDFSFEPALNLDPRITRASHLAFPDVEAAIKKHNAALLGRANEIWQRVNERIAVCIRELLADLLAVRMMGFGFFAAHTEFLKTIAAWPESLITDGGYPGTKFRVWSILRHLLDDAFPGNIRTFLKTASAPIDLTLKPIEDYLKEWQARASYGTDLQTKPVAPDPSVVSGLSDAINALAERAVLAALDPITNDRRRSHNIEHVLRDSEAIVLQPRCATQARPSSLARTG